MIFGIGTDIIELETVNSKLKEIKGLKEELFTENEIKYCDSKRYPEQHYAGRFAAKEAFFKATGTGWGRGYAFDQVEINSDESGKPEISLTGKSKALITEHKISKIHVSISHTKKMATAFVILEI